MGGLPLDAGRLRALITRQLAGVGYEDGDDEPLDRGGLSGFRNLVLKPCMLLASAIIAHLYGEADDIPVEPPNVPGQPDGITTSGAPGWMQLHVQACKAISMMIGPAMHATIRKAVD